MKLQKKFDPDKPSTLPFFISGEHGWNHEIRESRMGSGRQAIQTRKTSGLVIYTSGMPLGNHSFWSDS